jgi:hypothetical protein
LKPVDPLAQPMEVRELPRTAREEPMYLRKEQARLRRADVVGGAAAAPDQSVAIEDRMDGALGGTPDIAVETPDRQSRRILRAP